MDEFVCFRLIRFCQSKNASEELQCELWMPIENVNLLASSTPKDRYGSFRDYQCVTTSPGNS